MPVTCQWTAPAAPYYPNGRGWGTGPGAPLSAGHTCGHVRGVRGQGRSGAGLLLGETPLLKPTPGPSRRPRAGGLLGEEGRGRYSRREAGRREQGPSPQAGRLQPAQARLLPAGRPRASRLCRPLRAPRRPRSRGSAPSSPAGRGPALAVPLVRSARRRAAPRFGRRVPPPPRARSRPGAAARGLCLRLPPPPIRSGWLSSAAVTAARPSGGALRPLPLITPVAHRGAQAPPSQRAGPGVSAALPVGKAALGGARRVGAPRGPGGDSAVASQARWSRGSGRDGSCGSLRPNAQAAAVGSSRKGAPFPRVGKGGARSALSRTRATPARAGWPGWVGFVRSLAVTRQGHTWSVGSRSQLEDHSGVVFVFTIGVI